jgi:hypothetical protein
VVSYCQCNVQTGHHCVLEIIWSLISWYLLYKRHLWTTWRHLLFKVQYRVQPPCAWMTASTLRLIPQWFGQTIYSTFLASSQLTQHSPTLSNPPLLILDFQLYIHRFQPSTLDNWISYYIYTDPNPPLLITGSQPSPIVRFVDIGEFIDHHVSYFPSQTWSIFERNWYIFVTNCSANCRRFMIHRSEPSPLDNWIPTLPSW